MATHCPLCNFLNPYGAQICGECGNVLISDQTQARSVKRDLPKAPSGIKWKFIGLRRANRERKSPLVVALTLSLFIYGLAILILSVATWLRPSYGLGFICMPAHLYPFLTGVFLGTLTIFIAYGLYCHKHRMLLWYLVWVGIQALLLLLMWVGWRKAVWLSIKAQIIFGLIILAEILLVPIVLRLKAHSS